MKKLNLTQNGIGLIGALVAAALIVVIALVISQYVVHQNQATMTLETSASCQQVLKTAMDYFSKDDNSLNITTYGPVPLTSNFDPNADTSTDGLPRFLFNGEGIPGHVRTDAGIPITGLTTTSAAVPVPASIRFTNFLNKRNTYSRMITLAANRDVCFADLDGSGDVVYEDNNAQNLSGLIINEQGVKIYLFVDPRENDTSLCSGARLSRLPDPKLTNEVKYKVRVTLFEGEQIQKGCESSSSVFIGQDTSAPFTVMTLSNATATAPNTLNPTLCDGGKIGNLSLCSAASSINIDVSTVANEVAPDSITGKNCSQCFAALRNYNCLASGPKLFNNFENCISNATTARACRAVDPGAIYLCRIGEAKWFGNQGRNFWQPCHEARVWRWDTITNTSIPVGNPVRIEYRRDAAQIQLTDRTTSARIILSGLPQMAYKVDVRAVDTGGSLVGPAFCGLANCSEFPTFVVNTNSPTLTPLEPGRNIVGSVTNALAGSTARNAPAGAMAPFGNNLFQCQSNANESFRSTSNYTVPTGAETNLGISGACTSQYTSGGAGNIPCTCDDLGECRITAGATGSAGTYGVRMDFNNECGFNANTNRNWCYDPTINYTVAATQTAPIDTTPSFNLTNGGKACGLSTKCPALPVAGGYSLNAACSSIVGWNVAIHAGCLAASGYKQFCASGYDPCGRGFEAPTEYESLLPLATTGNPNLCQTISGSRVGGNRCDTGWCNNSTKCQSTCGFSGQSCSADTECTDGSVCSGQIGSCNGINWSCQAATGTFAPVNPATCSGSCVANILCNGISSAARKCANNLNGPACSVNADCPSSTCVDTGVCGDTSSAVCASNTQCRKAGSCIIAAPSDRGTCSCPTNKSCEKCPPNGTPLACPQANACEPTAAPAFSTFTCGGCTPGAQVWSETSRSNCTATICGTAGTITINESCHNGCASCGTRTRTIACSAEACGKWCRTGSDNFCASSNINPASSCTPGQFGYINQPVCYDTPRAYLTQEWTCVPTADTCPPSGTPIVDTCTCEDYVTPTCTSAPTAGGCYVTCNSQPPIFYRCR